MPSHSPSADTSRAAYIRQIEDALGQRKLYWFGPRGADGRALLALDQFDGAFSIMAPLEAVSVSHDVSLETLTGHRVDHNTYSFEEDTSDALKEFRGRLLAVLNQASAIVPYRPNRFLSNICFPRADTSQHLGMFHEHQSQFEHKPWVETELKKIGVPTLPWMYLADEDRPRLVEFFTRHGSIVLRASRSDGGARVALITTLDELARHMPQHDDGFLCACKFYDQAIPLNLNGCIFRDGTVLLHGLSEQLIGLPELTRRRFGYCGNVFRRGDDWSPELIQQFEHYAKLAGRWLHSQGYLGVFGLDALFVDGSIYIVEVNPRFQGSTWAVGRTDRYRGLPDLYLLQIAVFLALPPPFIPPFRQRISQQQSETLAIVYNLNTEPVTLAASQDISGMEFDLVPSVEIKVHPEALTARLLLDHTRQLVDKDVSAWVSQLKGDPVQSPMFLE